MRRKAEEFRISRNFINRDTWYKHIRSEISTGRALGMVILSRNNNGTYTRTYGSFFTVYTVFILILTSCLFYSTLMELINIIYYNKVPGSYVIFITLFCYPLPFIFIVESRKMPEFFNAWLKFQIDFQMKTGVELDFTAVHFRVIGFFAKIFFSVLFLVVQQYQFPVLTPQGVAFILYEYWILTTITSFWTVFIFFLYRSGNAMHKLVKKLVRTKTLGVSFDEVEILWYDLYRLVKMTGRTFCFTYCYFILFMFLLGMVTAYETLIFVHSTHLLMKSVFILLTFTVLFHTASIPYISQMASRKIGEDLYKLLLDLKMKERNPWMKPDEMDGLIQAISDNQLTIDLGGFVTLDNGLITSLMSTMVTYLIVLVQFKV